MIKFIFAISFFFLGILGAYSQDLTFRHKGILFSIANRAVFFSTEQHDIEKFLNAEKDSGVAVPYGDVVGRLIQSADSISVTWREEDHKGTISVSTMKLRYSSVILTYRVTDPKFYKHNCSVGFERNGTDYFMNYYCDAGFAVIVDIKPIKKNRKKER